MGGNISDINGRLKKSLKRCMSPFVLVILPSSALEEHQQNEKHNLEDHFCVMENLGK